MTSSIDGSTASEWLKAKDSKGRTFYANRLTRQTQWEVPFELQTRKNIDEAKNPTTTHLQLPPFWEERIDPTSKRIFYINHVNKETTWEHPALSNNSINNSSNSSNNNNNNYSNNSHHPQFTPKKIERAAPVVTYHADDCNDYFYQQRRLPQKEFKLYHVLDEERSSCQGCNVIFYVGRRKHHCRSCGDVFCVSCSPQKCLLPYFNNTSADSDSKQQQQQQQQQQQRVCNLCYKDIQQQQCTSKPIMRRYLSTLHFFHPTKPQDNVIAALTSFTSDLHAMLSSFSHDEKDNIIPDAHILVPTIGRLLLLRPAVDDISVLAINSLATLLALGSVIGDTSFACALYSSTGSTTSSDSNTIASGPASTTTTTLHSLIHFLENNDINLKSSSDNNNTTRSLAIKEQAARALFYATDKPVIEALLRLNVDDEDTSATGCSSSCLDSLNVREAFQIMLDNAILCTSASSSLQRWCVAAIRNLVAEDYRRATKTDYESFVLSDYFTTSGSVMILCSLMSAEDADTRSHATYTLTFIVDAIVQRAVSISTTSATTTSILSTIILQISENACCGDSLAQLILSSDNSVASLGLTFVLSLVSPLLKEPVVPSALTEQSKVLLSIKGAALTIATQSCCLAVFVQIIKSENARPMDLRASAMTCLAAICIACSTSCNSPNDNNNMSALTAVTRLQEEEVAQVCVSILSQSSQSILLFNGAHHDSSPSSQLLEAAAISLGAALGWLDINSAVIVDWTKKIMFDLFSLANEQGMQNPSKLRGMWTLRCLPFLECASKLIRGILIISTSDTTTTDTLDCLLEALDAGAITLAMDLIASREEAEATTTITKTHQLCGHVMLRISSCRLINDLICLSKQDETLIGKKRLHQAIAFSLSSSFSTTGEQQGNMAKEYGKLVSNIISLLNLAVTRSFKQEEVDAGGVALLQELVGQCTSVLGSLFGAPFIMNETASSSSSTAYSNDVLAWNCDDDSIIILQRTDFCACAISPLFISGNDIVATMLVGGFGEGCINQALRLIRAIVINGPEHLHRKIAHSGILVPVIDLLQNSHDQFRFLSCIAIIRCCCLFITSEGGMISSLRRSVGTIAKELALVHHNNGRVDQCNISQNRKYECICCLEAMSKNPSLWNAIAASIPLIAKYIESTQSNLGGLDLVSRLCICAAIRTIRNVIQQPSHALNTANSTLPASLCRLISEDCTAKTTRLTQYSNHLMSSKGAMDEEKMQMENDVQVLALEVLATVAFHSGPIKRDDKGLVRLLNCGFIDAACLLLSERGVVNATADHFAVPILKTGLSLIHSFLFTDFKNNTSAEQVIRILGKQHMFIKALCATLLVEEKLIDQPSSQSVYGPPLISVGNAYAGCKNSHHAAVTLLISLASFFVSASHACEEFWKLFAPVRFDQVNERELATAATVACMALLPWSIEDNAAEYTSALKNVIRPALSDVKRQLLNCICKNILSYESLSRDIADNVPLAIVNKHKVPELCLEICRTYSALVLPACTLFEIIQDRSPMTLSDCISNKRQLYLFFDMLQSASEGEASSSSLEGMRILCNILVALPRPCLGTMVAKYKMKTVAISGLSSVFNLVVTNEFKAFASSSMVEVKETVLWCLLSIAFPHVALDQVRQGIAPLSTCEADLDASEARELASTIGGSISMLIIDHFMYFASAKISDDRSKQENNEKLGLLVRSPEALLLCALSSTMESLCIICEHGGLEAIILLAHEQDANAIRALRMAAKQDSLLVIKSEGHNCIIEVLCSLPCDETVSHPILILCLDFIKIVCKSSYQGRQAVINARMAIHSIDVVCDLIFQLSCKLFTGMRCPNAEHHQQSKLFVLACTFLTDMSHCNVHRKIIAKKDNLLEMCSKIATEENYDMAYVAAKLMAALAPTIADNFSINFTPENLAGTFCLVLQRNQFPVCDSNEPVYRDASLVEYYRLLSIASDGLQCVFGRISSASREVLVNNTFHCFQKLVVLSDEVLRAEEPFILSDAAGILASNLSNLFVTMSREDSWRLLLTESRIVQDMCRMIILYDLALEEQGQHLQPPSGDTVHWKAARAHCLQCISSLLCTDSCMHHFTSGLEHVASSSFDGIAMNGENGLHDDHHDTRLNGIALRQFMCAVERISLQSNDAVAAIAAQAIFLKLA